MSRGLAKDRDFHGPTHSPSDLSNKNRSSKAGELGLSFAFLNATGNTDSTSAPITPISTSSLGEGRRKCFQKDVGINPLISKLERVFHEEANAVPGWDSQGLVHESPTSLVGMGRV